MHRSIVSRLRCPLCKSGLAAHAFQETPDDIIEDGVLLCEGCRTWYPVSRFVPVLLDFDTSFHFAFAERHADALAGISSYKRPAGEPRRGEASIQETFSDEWDLVQESDLSFSYTADDLQSIHREVWMKWLAKAPEKPKLVLNVGCGLGRETEAIQAAIGDGVEIFGVDLNFALLQRGTFYRDRPRIHILVASLFALPFEERGFDLVYSQGVIHHTFSTKAAFEAISTHVREGGRMFIWVYGLDDHLAEGGIKGIATRLMWHGEKAFRPLISRSPRRARDVILAAVTAVAHPIFLQAPSVKRLRGKWKWRNTNHALRDRLPPMFAHRHSFNEVIEWFERAGFDIIDIQSASIFKRIAGRPLWGVGLTGERPKLNRQ